MSACVVLLAAGGGSRFAGAEHKLRAPFRGRPLVAWALEAAAGAGLPLLVVTGAVEVADLLPSGATEVRNERWSKGQATSLQAGLTAADGAGHDVVVVGLGDQPFVPAEAWRRVAEECSTSIAVATYEGRRGNPVRLHAEIWPLLPIAGDEGARSLMDGRPDLVTPVACPGHPVDIDTTEELEQWS